MAQPTERIGHLRQARGMAVLWFALLAGPLAWMLGLNAQYSLVRVACAKDNMLYLHAVSVLTLLLALAGGWVAWREWKLTGRHGPDEEAGGTLARSRFMVGLALLASALFGVAILAQWVANFFLNPCMGI